MGIATKTDLEKRIAAGKGFMGGFTSTTAVAFTAAVAASGFFGGQILANLIGSTMPGTMVGLPQAPSPPNEMLLTHWGNSSSNSGIRPILCRLYKFGTLNLAATGDQFTHDAATFPVLRKVFGAASQPIPLIPLLQITTATTTTAAIITLKTAAGGTGYVDALGNNTVGTKTFTMPAAATAIGSTFLLRMETGDVGVRNIAAIQVNTAAAAGAATIWGMEILAIHKFVGTSIETSFGEYAFKDGLYLPDTNPAVATSGTVTSLLAIVHFGGAITGAVDSGQYGTVLNS